MIKHKEFWDGKRGLANIKPKRIGSKWESFDAVKIVRTLCGEGTVNDVGCGTGRLSEAFGCFDYAGFDLNPAAIEIANRRFFEQADRQRQYEFNTVEDYKDIPAADIFLFHSSALHIPDDELVTLSKRAGHKIVIGETLRGHTNKKPNPKPGLAPHYSRSAQDYVKLLLPDWTLRHNETIKDTNSRKAFTYMVFER